MKNAKFWYIRFEGTFTNEHPEYPENGVFSSCLIPESNFEAAYIIFIEALKQERIVLVDLIEEFEIDGNELDPEDEDNTFWIKWYKKVAKLHQIDFDTWRVFKRTKAKKVKNSRSS